MDDLGEKAEAVNVLERERILGTQDNSYTCLHVEGGLNFGCYVELH